jgi:hypothetical protein
VPQSVCEHLKHESTNAVFHFVDSDFRGGVHFFNLDPGSWPPDLGKLFVTLDGRTPEERRRQISRAEDGEREGRVKKRKISGSNFKDTVTVIDLSD